MITEGKVYTNIDFQEKKLCPYCMEPFNYYILYYFI